MKIKNDLDKNNHQAAEEKHYCFDCCIQKWGLQAIDDDNDETVKDCTETCSKCVSGSNWNPQPGDERFLIDPEDLVKGAILVDCLGEEHEITSALKKKCEPSMFKIKTDLPIPEYIRVEDTVYYSLKGV